MALHSGCVINNPSPSDQHRQTRCYQVAPDNKQWLHLWTPSIHRTYPPAPKHEWEQCAKEGSGKKPSFQEWVLQWWGNTLEWVAASQNKTRLQSREESSAFTVLLPFQNVEKGHLCVDIKDARDHEWIKKAKEGHEGCEFIHLRPWRITTVTYLPAKQHKRLFRIHALSINSE